jgi:FkbM family methyltransferase
MKTLTLPAGQKIWTLNNLEAAVIAHEIFVMGSYSKHGIKIDEGDCIFDVGANIGLYTLFLAESCHNLRVFAFEPISDVFAVLQRNIETYAAHLNVKLFNAALADRVGTAPFVYDPASSLTTTMRPDAVAGSVRKDAALKEWLIAGVLDLKRVGRISSVQANVMSKALSIRVLNLLAYAALLIPLAFSEFRRRLFMRRIECQLTTISDVIRDHNLDTIHLLKIDVEGSESDVINGIAPQDWSKIRQFVVEVHDVDGRVKTLRQLFEKHGYQTVVDQEAWALHNLMGIFTLYAARDG